MGTPNRRRFLEESMVAAATLAAGAVPKIAAAEETPPQSRSANERLGVAVVGVRGRGNSHLGAFAGRRDAEVRYIVDTDSEVGNKRVAETARRQGGRKPRFVEDMRAALDDDSVDVVSIATPNHWHALAAIWSIQAGKDVYVESPVSHNLSEGRRIVEAAEKYNRICQTGSQSRSNAGAIEAMKFVRGDELGDVRLALGLCSKARGSIGERGFYPPPRSVNYDLWLGPAPLAPVTRKQFHYDWRWQWPYGNGDLGNQGIHQMDLARWGLGVNRLSDVVMSFGGRFGRADAGDSANLQVVIHDFGDRALAVETRAMQPKGIRGGRNVVIFECADGYLVMTGYSAGSAFDLEGRMIKSFHGGGNHFANFLSAVRSRRREDLNADIEEGHLSSGLCHLGNISYRLGADRDRSFASDAAPSCSSAFESALDRLREVLEPSSVEERRQVVVGPRLAVDPKTESFSNDAVANRMLTREYRAPFIVPGPGEV